MIEKDHSKIPLKRQAELLSVRRAGLYYIPVGKSEKEISLMHAIDRIYTRWPAFGYRRITAKLQDQGFAVNRKEYSV